MKLMVIGASKGLGRAFVEGLCQPGDTAIGVSRTRPTQLDCGEGVDLHWIEADLSQPARAAASIAAQAPPDLDVLIHNLGIWEETAFSDDYDFLNESDSALAQLVDVNITATLLLLKQLLPRVLGGRRPQLVLTGSTSALPRSGRPEVAFGASKFALNGIADALREGFRRQRLAVTTLQLGYLNTDDALSVPLQQAAARGDGEYVRCTTWCRWCAPCCSCRPPVSSVSWYCLRSPIRVTNAQHALATPVWPHTRPWFTLRLLAVGRTQDRLWLWTRYQGFRRGSWTAPCPVCRCTCCRPPQ